MQPRTATNHMWPLEHLKGHCGLWCYLCTQQDLETSYGKRGSKQFYSLDFIVHIFNIRTQEAVASGSLWVQGQPDQHRAFQASKDCLQNNRQKKSLHGWRNGQRHRGHIVFTKDLSQVPSTLSDSPSSDALRRRLKRKRPGYPKIVLLHSPPCLSFLAGIIPLCPSPVSCLPLQTTQASSFLLPSPLPSPTETSPQSNSSAPLQRFKRATGVTPLSL